MRFTSKAYYLGILNDGAAPSEYVKCSTLLKKYTPQNFKQRTEKHYGQPQYPWCFFFRVNT